MANRVIIPFFTDENVPDSVGRALLDARHGVTRLREVMEQGTADPVIAVACAQNGQVLITCDNDFKAIARRLQITQRAYQKTLHKVQLACGSPMAKDRIIDALSLIEHEWQLIQPDRPLTVQITNTAIRTQR